MAVVNAEKNDQGKYDCPLGTCSRRGSEGLPTPGAVGLHVKAHHKTLWTKLFKKEHGEPPPDERPAPAHPGTNGKPMNGKARKSRTAELVGARYSARPRIDRKMETAAHENALATMEAAAEVMGLPSVRALHPARARELFQALVNVNERQAAKANA